MGKKKATWGFERGAGKGKKEEKPKLAGAEHTSGARGSTEQRHQDGQDRKQVDQQGEKSQKAGRRGFNANTRTGRQAAAAKKAADKKQGRGGR